MPPLSVLIKPVSGLCNMNCDYCFYCDETEKRAQRSYGMMTEDTLKNVIRRTILQAEGSITYAFQGGEPTLRGIEFFRRAVALQKQYNKNNIAVMNGFQTNGLLLDEEWCRFFAEQNFLVGISLDGTEMLHDQYRHSREGAGTHSRVLQSIGLLEQYGAAFNILTVVTGPLAERIEEVYLWYAKRGWSFQQYIVCLDPLGEPHGRRPYAITPEQYGRFLVTLFNLWYKDWLRDRQPYIRQFENYIAILLGYQPEACDQRGRCSLQTVVEADGSVYPCDFYVLDAYRLGNLNTQRLEDINRRGEASGFAERSAGLSGDCISCRYSQICRGGCQRSRDQIETSGLYKSYFCRSYQMFFDQCLEKMKYVAQSIRSAQQRRRE